MGKSAKKMKIIYKLLHQSMKSQHLPGTQNTDCHILKSLAKALWGLWGLMVIETENIFLKLTALCTEATLYHTKFSTLPLV